MKKTIRLNESQLRNIVSKSVKRILHESEEPPKGWVKFETGNGPVYMDPDGKTHVPGENGKPVPAQKTPYKEKRLKDKEREWAFNDAVRWIEDGFDNFNDWYDFNSDMGDWNDYDSGTDEGDGFFNRNTRYQLKDIFNQALKACGHTSFYTDIPEYETED